MIRYCTTPRKHVVYAPMGAQRAESHTVALYSVVMQFRTILSSAYDVTITVRCVLVWICAIL